MNKLAIMFLLLCAGSAFAMNIPLHCVGKDGKPNGDEIVITPYKDHAEISIGANDAIVVPYYGNADGSGWEYQNEHWDIIMGKSSPNQLSVMAFETGGKHACGGKVEISANQ